MKPTEVHTPKVFVYMIGLHGSVLKAFKKSIFLSNATSNLILSTLIYYTIHLKR